MAPVMLSLIEKAGCFALNGAKAANPLEPGQAIEFHSQFEDGEPTGPALGAVIQPGVGHLEYVVKVHAVQNAYYSSHLMSGAPVSIQLLNKKGEETRKRRDEEPDLVIKFAIIADPATTPDLTSYRWLGKGVGKTIEDEVKFAREMLCSDIKGIAKELDIYHIR